ncbi:MAG: glycerol-3-phosphate responsive antiterminator [Bacillota bacterium]
MIKSVDELVDILIENPVVAAVRDGSMLERALESDARVVFMLFGSIGEMERQCSRLYDAGKIFFLHVDLIEGLRPDAVGVRYIASKMKPAGIITTKGACVRMAHDAGLFAIQRVFLLDSSALRSGVQNIVSCRPDLVEILPGVSDRVLTIAQEQISLPMIAGGLIYNKEDVITALSAGVIAVSTSCESLWNMNK